LIVGKPCAARLRAKVARGKFTSPVLSILKLRIVRKKQFGNALPISPRPRGFGAMGLLARGVLCPSRDTRGTVCPDVLVDFL
jgi:hypothetical protein